MGNPQQTDLPADSDTPREAVTQERTRIHLHVSQVVSNRYEILEKLGRGGMGEVWRVYDLKLRVEVALKSVRRTTPDALESLRREVRTAREVISPNVCRIFDLVVEEGQEFISMEYVDGQTLLALLRDRSPLELGEAREIASQFLAGLEAIHQAGFVHRDLKPENIMITQTGRVVVMDFGIAKPVAQIGEGISGTLPYMSPEQLAGSKVDARADVFAAGVLLAEMITPIRDHKSRENVWNAIREERPKVPDSPWQPVIVRALEKYPEERFASAGALSRALEEVTQRIETLEEIKPYPGLSSFTESDTEYFFGRELEAENVLKKIHELHLMAIIGPSGAGKTSFLRAGLIPVLPANWSYALTQPGDSPLSNLGQALAAEFSGDSEAIRKMVRLDNTDDALWLLHRWRQKHPEALLIVDRFEELFTLNDHETQIHFAELLGRAVLEADIRVLLAMRDDFLIFCREHASLTPIFSDLTALLPLSGPALRRALIQPALQSGYRFEDETLVDEILRDVEKERGALPLMAFAASRLWVKRDRKNGLLTREMYQQIGGVAGALSQHAEEAMDRIGSERHSIVREIFRNLITAQNTRAVRDTEEILSIFENRKSAEEVLHALIDARLLSSFEAPAQDGEKPRSRIEIIHESLLSAWPRLVRWQTQDADSAQLRDQLRQAAQTWQERNQSQDLLWTGTAFLEFQAWRQRYPGGLTAAEEAFANAMVNRATKRRRQRRIIISTTFIVLLLIIAVIANFWKESDQARQKEQTARKQAVSEAHQAEASKLLALGRANPDADASTKLAYALASLEISDSAEGRHFALQALSTGPPARVIEMTTIRPLDYIEFSPNGKWLAAGGTGGVQLLPRDGSTPIILSDKWPVPLPQGANAPQFSPNGEFVIWTPAEDQLRTVKVWSLSKRKIIRTFDMKARTTCIVRGGKAFFITNQPRESVFQSWGFDENNPVEVFRWEPEGVTDWDIDYRGQRIGYTKGHDVYLRSLDALRKDEKLVGSHSAETKLVRFQSNGNQIASADSTGEIRLWSLLTETRNPDRVIAGNGALMNLWFDPKGSYLFASHRDSKTIRRWDLTAPDDTEPLVFSQMSEWGSWVTFDKDNRWMAVAWHQSLAFYPLSQSYPYIFHGTGQEGSFGIGFTPNGKALINSFSFDALRMWYLPGEKQFPTRNLWTPPGGMLEPMDVDPTGRYVLVGTGKDGVHLISIKDGEATQLKSMLPGKEHTAVAFSPDGRFAAAATSSGSPENFGIEIWDLKSGSSRILKGIRIYKALRFAPDGSLFSGDMEGNLTRWNLNDGSKSILGKGKGIVHSIAITRDGWHVATATLSAKQIGDIPLSTSELVLYDLKNGKSFPISSHGNRVMSVAFDPAGTKLVTGDIDGIVRVGSINGDVPHLLIGPELPVRDIAVHPNGSWIAATLGRKPIVRLIRMPEGKPFHTLPYKEFLDRLKTLTNARIIADPKSTTGYRTIYGAFPGWEKLPKW